MATPIENHVEIADYESQAHEFLANSRDFLAAGNLHQASEKGWGAAAHMAKAVAVAQGWEYGTHADFSEVLYQASLLANNPRIQARCSRHRQRTASELLQAQSGILNSGAIQADLERIAELLEALHPLTGLPR